MVVLCRLETDASLSPSGQTSTLPPSPPRYSSPLAHPSIPLTCGSNMFSRHDTRRNLFVIQSLSFREFSKEDAAPSPSPATDTRRLFHPVNKSRCVSFAINASDTTLPHHARDWHPAGATQEDHSGSLNNRPPAVDKKQQQAWFTVGEELNNALT